MAGTTWLSRQQVIDLLRGHDPFNLKSLPDSDKVAQVSDFNDVELGDLVVTCLNYTSVYTTDGVDSDDSSCEETDVSQPCKGIQTWYLGRVIGKDQSKCTLQILDTDTLQVSNEHYNASSWNVSVNGIGAVQTCVHGPNVGQFFRLRLIDEDMPTSKCTSPECIKLKDDVLGLKARVEQAFVRLCTAKAINSEDDGNEDT